MGDDEGADAIAEEYQLRFPPPPDMVDVPPAPTEENAEFGLSAMAVEPEAAGAASVPGGPERPSPAPTVPMRTVDRAPARNDDEDWAASPW